MTNSEILTKAVVKAIDNGWDVQEVHLNKEWFETGHQISGSRLMHFRDIIFNHQFAKALWPDRIIKNKSVGRTGEETIIRDWTWHLMNMAIADDPIKYLSENI